MSTAEIFFEWIDALLSIIVILVLFHNALMVRRVLRHGEAVSDVLAGMMFQVLSLAGTSAEHSAVVASDLAAANKKVATVAANLQSAHDRADAVNGTNPGEAADAASRSGQHD